MPLKLAVPECDDDGVPVLLELDVPVPLVLAEPVFEDDDVAV